MAGVFFPDRQSSNTHYRKYIVLLFENERVLVFESEITLF